MNEGEVGRRRVQGEMAVTGEPWQEPGQAWLRHNSNTRGEDCNRGCVLFLSRSNGEARGESYFHLCSRITPSEKRERHSFTFSLL